MQYVFKTKNLKRYSFPTHINDLVVDRSDAGHSEVFMVTVEPGKAVPPHKHDDAEQIYYVTEGEGTLAVGPRQETHALRPGDVVRIPPATLHAVSPGKDRPLKYLAVDCFGAGPCKDEPTWDAHVRAMCRERGWDYAKVVQR